LDAPVGLGEGELICDFPCAQAGRKILPFLEEVTLDALDSLEAALEVKEPNKVPTLPLRLVGLS
jgi:hypothetical protein